MSLVNAQLHPSQYQNNVINNVSNNLKNTQTLINLTNERKNIFGLKGNEPIMDLVSPGTFNFTTNDKQISGSNTRFLFKNLYGETPLTFGFFSEENIINIQNLSKMRVHKQMNYVISDQSLIDVQIIMRSIFLAYSEHPPLIDETMSDKEIQKLINLYINEIARLNELVLDIIVPKICSQLQAYLDYLRDAGTPPSLIPRPQDNSVTGTRNYRSITNVLTGSTL